MLIIIREQDEGFWALVKLDNNWSAQFRPNRASAWKFVKDSIQRLVIT